MELKKQNLIQTISFILIFLSCNNNIELKDKSVNVKNPITRKDSLYYELETIETTMHEVTWDSIFKVYLLINDIKNKPQVPLIHGNIYQFNSKIYYKGKVPFFVSIQGVEYYYIRLNKDMTSDVLFYFNTVSNITYICVFKNSNIYRKSGYNYLIKNKDSLFFTNYSNSVNAEDRHTIIKRFKNCDKKWVEFEFRQTLPKYKK